MKKLASLIILSTLLLTACNNLTVIDSDTLKEYPELKGVATSWQALSDAAAAEDCETFLDHMRDSLVLTEEDCPAAFEFFEDGVPPIDWARTEWNDDGGKVKIFEVNSGSITGFILNTVTDVWGASEVFWD